MAGEEAPQTRGWRAMPGHNSRLVSETGRRVQAFQKMADWEKVPRGMVNCLIIGKREFK